VNVTISGGFSAAYRELLPDFENATGPNRDDHIPRLSRRPNTVPAQIAFFSPGAAALGERQERQGAIKGAMKEQRRHT
jgi:hypothetical protein